MKQRVMLTEHQTETWLAVLSRFPVPVVNQAVIRMGLSTDPFPDLGKLVITCQKLTRRQQYAPGRDEDVISNTTIRHVAEALELEVCS